IALARCPLLVELSPQRRMRVRRLASEHTILDGEPVPARFLGDRVAWIVLEGLVVSGRDFKREGGLVYPESVVAVDGVTAAGRAGLTCVETPSRRRACWLPSAVPITSRPIQVASVFQIFRPPTTNSSRISPGVPSQVRMSAIALCASTASALPKFMCVR